MALNELERKFFKAPKRIDSCDDCTPEPEPIPVLESLAITPATISIAEDATQQLTVTGTYDDTSTEDLTASATYESDDETVATVSASGLVTAILAGTANVTATVDSISDSVVVTVTE